MTPEDAANAMADAVEAQNVDAPAAAAPRFVAAARLRLDAPNVRTLSRDRHRGRKPRSRREMLGRLDCRDWSSLPSALASFVYVFVFTAWTLYISMSNCTLLPTYNFVGLKPLFRRSGRTGAGRSPTAISFCFSAFYVVWRLADRPRCSPSLIDQRVRGEAFWRTIFLYPLAVSFVVTGTVWSWLYNPDAGHRVPGAQPRLDRFQVRLDRRPRLRDLRDHHHRHLAVVGLRDGAFPRRPALGRSGPRSRRRRSTAPSSARIYRKVILPSIAPIFVAVAVVLLQFAIKTFDLVVALTRGGPGISTTFPAIYVYDLMFQRGQIGDRRGRRDHDAAGARRRAGALCALDRSGARAAEAAHG